MTKIELTTKVNAPIRKVFDINRDIDIHKLSTAKSKETAIAGTTSGLININETVTWRGKHFGFYLTHKSISSYTLSVCFMYFWYIGFVFTIFSKDL